MGSRTVRALIGAVVLALALGLPAESIRQRINTTVTSLANGYVLEDVQCDLVPNYVEGRMTYVRRDTGEVVGSRELYPIERQETIPA